MKRQILPADGKPTPLQPLIHAALAARGIDAGDLARNRLWHGGEGFGKAAPGQPYVHSDPEDSRATWKEPGVEIDFRVQTTYAEPDLWIHKLEVTRPEIPETVVNAAPGMTLERIVSIPGADGIEIEKAWKEGRRACFLLKYSIVGALVP